MNSNDYVIAANNTLSGGFNLETPNEFHILHAAMGMCTEIGELVVALQSPIIDVPNMVEEIGDVFWYIAIVQGIAEEELEYNADWIKVNGFTSVRDVVDCSVVEASELLDLVKKQAFYGKEIPAKDIWDKTENVFNLMTTLCEFMGVSVEEVREINIRKLSARYSGGYSNDKAINRDLETERNILEGRDGNAQN